MFTNWKTTIAGMIAGLPLAIDAVAKAYADGQFNGQHGVQLALGVGLVVLGALAKDHNNTGGTNPVTEEAVKRVG